MQWNEFGQRLQATLRTLTDRCYLIVSAPADGGYVQFARATGALIAEASGPGSVGGAATHQADDPALLAAGWTAPADHQPNWSFELPLPALTSEYAGLAERCTVALRDVLQVAAPDTLTYSAWRDPALQPAGVTWSPERIDELDRGQFPLPLPTLGLPLESVTS